MIMINGQLDGILQKKVQLGRSRNTNDISQVEIKKSAIWSNLLFVISKIDKESVRLLKRGPEACIMQIQITRPRFLAKQVAIYLYIIHVDKLDIGASRQTCHSLF